MGERVERVVESETTSVIRRGALVVAGTLVVAGAGFTCFSSCMALHALLKPRPRTLWGSTSQTESELKGLVPQLGAG